MKIHRVAGWTRKAALLAAITCGTTLQLQNCSAPVKDAILQGESDDALIPVAWSCGNQGPEALPLGELKRQIMRITAGRKIAYVVDCAFTEENVRRIVALGKAASTAASPSALVRA